MVTIEELNNKLDKSNHEIAELRKAFTTEDAPTSMQITYTDELKSKVFEKAPFFRFLESKGRVQKVDTSIVGFYKKTVNQNAQWMKETDTIPNYTKGNFQEETDKMKTIIYPIEVSMLSQMGINKIDVLKDAINDGFIDVYNQVDNALLQGNGTAASKDMKGLTKTITTNTKDLNGEPITEEAIDDMLQAIVDDNGGTPDSIVTNFEVAKQLKKIVADYRRYNDKIDIGLGHRVVAYESITGIEVPILVDGNFKPVNGESSMAIIDSSTIEVKRLLEPTLLQDLPTDILGYKNAIVSFLTAQNIAEFQDGIITGIGATSPSGSGSSLVDDDT